MNNFPTVIEIVNPCRVLFFTLLQLFNRIFKNCDPVFMLNNFIMNVCVCHAIFFLITLNLASWQRMSRDQLKTKEGLWCPEDQEQKNEGNNEDDLSSWLLHTK